MDDSKIIELFFKRNELAITESEKKYGRYCHTIAYNILYSEEDSDECVNDTWHNAWCSIPPQKPKKLQCYLGRITRNLALDRYGYNKAEKRNFWLQSAIDEYYECIPSGEACVEDAIALKEIINRFLESLDKRDRVIFMRRYWYACSVSEIAKSMKLSDNHISIILYRTRNRLKTYIEDSVN